MKTKKALWITVAVAVILVGMGAAVLARPSLAKTVPEGISFNGSSLAGLTPEEAKNKITEYMSYFNGRTIELSISGQKETITMDDIELEIAGEDTAIAELEDAIPYGNVFQRYKQEKDLEVNPVDIKPVVTYNKDTLTTIVSTLANKYHVDVQEPTYKKTGNGFVTTSGATGVDYNVTEIVAALNNYLQKGMPESGTSGLIQYTANATLTQPSVPVGAYDNLNANVLGTFTTIFDAGEIDRTENLRVACERLNGLVILPGVEASLLNMLAPITEAGGYKDAITIIGGNHVPDLAGGICQVATTLYNSLLRAELEITHRRNHSHVSAYVDYAMDAMIYPGGNDFKFRNNLENPIYIEAGIQKNGSNSKITITIYGTEYRAANRTIQFYHKTLSEVFPDPLYVVNRYTPSNAPAATDDIPRRLTRTIVEVYPKVVAECWKRILVNGVVVDEVKINTSNYKQAIGTINASWDLTILYWLEEDENGDHVAKYVLKDGRHWKPENEREIDLSKVTIVPWVGQNLNEDGTPKPVETKPVETPEPTTPEQTTPEQTTPEATTPESTTPEQTTPAPTTVEPTTPEQTTPTTAEPTTAEPTTAEPTTPAPTTAEPTTPAPTTAEPTTPEPTIAEQTVPEATPEAASVEEVVSE